MPKNLAVEFIRVSPGFCRLGVHSKDNHIRLFRDDVVVIAEGGEARSALIPFLPMGGEDLCGLRRRVLKAWGNSRPLVPSMIRILIKPSTSMFAAYERQNWNENLRWNLLYVRDSIDSLLHDGSASWM